MPFSDWNKLMKFDAPWQARRTYARMKQSSPLFKGRCRLCERETEELYPIVIDLCKKCSEHLPELGGKLVRVKRYVLNHIGTCMRCNASVSKIYQFNIDICSNCMSRFDKSGRRQHKVGD